MNPFEEIGITNESIAYERRNINTVNIIFYVFSKNITFHIVRQFWKFIFIFDKEFENQLAMSYFLSAKDILSCLFLVVLLLFITHDSVNAQATITAVTDGEWGDSNTWDPVGVPGDNDVILIPSGVTVEVIGDYVLDNAQLVVEGVLAMSTNFPCLCTIVYGSLNFTGSSSGLVIVAGGQIDDDTILGSGGLSITIDGVKYWSGDFFCGSECGLIIGTYPDPPLTEDVNFPSSFSNPLPIELIDFTADYSNGKVLVNWSTASELNNSHFEIERSADGYNYDKIGEVNGAGNSQEIIHYSFEDKKARSANSHILYYRLKQIDFDGQFEIFRPEVVYIEEDNLRKTSLYPNPIHNQLNISLYSGSQEQTLIKIFNTNGQVVYSTERDLVNGLNEIEIPNLGSLPSGIYFVEVNSKSISFRDKVIKD